jgi:hypothetical protein
MKPSAFIYGFTGLRKTFLNRGVGFYAFTHLRATLIRMCVHVQVRAYVRTCMCVRVSRKCVNA